MGMIFGNPYTAASPSPEYGKPPVKNAWGVTMVWPDLLHSSSPRDFLNSAIICRKSKTR